VAHFTGSIHANRTQREAFDYMADLRNDSVWDPTIDDVVLVAGRAGREDGVYDVHVKLGPQHLVLRYHVTEWRAPDSLRVEAHHWALASSDEIRVRGDAPETTVTYDAELVLRGPLKLFDPLVNRRFQENSRRAATNLARILQA
jgi:Polyketide cyclase / dehydrase and lipid transport